MLTAASADVGDAEVVEADVVELEDIARTTTTSKASAASAASAVASLRRCSERTTVYDPSDVLMPVRRYCSRFAAPARGAITWR
jgi:hypothetical protein